MERHSKERLLYGVDMFWQAIVEIMKEAYNKAKEADKKSIVDGCYTFIATMEKCNIFTEEDTSNITREIEKMENKHVKTGDML